MITTVADFLGELKDAEAARLDAMEIEHGPTIGSMYEGLSAELLERAVPPQLGLQIVNGFVTDGLGNRSGQVDCMLVRGEGDVIPYTDSFVWPVKDVIAVFEVKKTLYHDQLVDAFAKLRSIRDLDSAYKIALRNSAGTVDIGSAQRAFAETTRTVAPDYEELSSLPISSQLIFHALVGEQLAPVGVVLGYHGYATEEAFRKSLLDHLKVNIGTLGYGPGSFPQLMISGRFSVGKANGQPYSARLHGNWWPFYFSSRLNPVLLLLEYVWTRLDLEFGIGGLWGEDLSVDVLSPFLLAEGTQQGTQMGWNLQWVELDEATLAETPGREPWEPAVLSEEEFVVITQLCRGSQVFFDDPDFLTYLDEHSVEPATLQDRLLDTGLVAMNGIEMELITDRCATAFLPDGRLVAGEDNTGRLTRWVEKFTTEWKAV
ncbi:DUF6602 domain-containing protein [Ilumatobacter nonamiensis]|uniref:DUF6602 domain-containing protein n=1 Tax=Ilumatobacter nonamiensis TaxID=467093 RepID=UPI000347C1FD|nr:DUF6602 domain-containing protein [Ilumatobacter nonamiensis]